MKYLGTIILVLGLLAGGSLEAQDAGTQSPFCFGTGARELALGGAVAANGSATAAPFWNPSRLATAERFAVSGFYTRLYESDVQYQYLGFVAPTLDFGTFGIGVFRLGIDGIEKRDATNTLLDNITDNRLALYLAYARSQGKYNFGAALTLEHHSLDEYSATSSPGFNLSVGRNFIIAGGIVKELDASVTARNLLKPGMQLDIENISYPMSISLGLALTLAPPNGGPHEALVAVAVNKSEYSDAAVRAGLEYRFNRILTLRGGIQNGDVSLGGGVEYKNIAFDYALVERELGSLHLFSLTTSFGSTVSDRLRDRAEKRESEFTGLMTERLNRHNVEMVDELSRQGEQLLSSGDFIGAASSFDRALFTARSSGVDTTALAQRVAEVRVQLDEVSRQHRYGQLMDSATVRFNAADYLGAKYFAGQASAEIPDAIEATKILRSATDSLTAMASREDIIGRQLIVIDSLLNYGQVATAMRIVQSLEQIAPDDPNVRQAVKRTRFENWRTQASEAYAAKQYQVALNALDSALTLYSGHQWCLDLSRRIARDVNQASVPQVAAAEPTTAPLSPEMRKEVDALYIAAQEFFRDGRLRQAIDQWERVDRLAPDYLSVRTYLVKAYKYVGVELYGQNKLEDAVAVWRKAATLEPDNEEIAGYIERTATEIRRLQELSYEAK